MTILGSDFDPTPDHGNVPAAPGLVSGELLPQLPSWNPDWTVDDYHIEMELYLRKLYEFLRKFGGKIGAAIYSGTTGHEIPGTEPTPATVKNEDINSLVRMYNTGMALTSDGTNDRDMMWLNSVIDANYNVPGGTYTQTGESLLNALTSHANMSLKVNYKVATPGGHSVVADNTHFISAHAAGTVDSLASKSYYTSIVVDKLVRLNTLIVPFIISSDGDIASISVNGTSQSISGSQPNRVSHQLASGWKYGSNLIEISAGTSLSGSLLIEWGTPTW